MRNIKFFPDPIIEYDFENVYRPSDDTYLVVDYLKFHVDNDYFDGMPFEKVNNWFVRCFPRSEIVIVSLIKFFIS